MKKTSFWPDSLRRTDSRPILYLATALLMIIMLGLIRLDAAQAQENDGTFEINDVIAEESDTDHITAQEVALDAAGNRYVFGRFNGNVEFGEGRNAQTLNGTDGDLFVAKYDANGSLQWVEEFETSVRGALPTADPTGIEYDDVFDNLYVAGHFRGGLDVGPESLSAGLDADGFIAQLNPETGDVQWVNQIISDNQPVLVRDISANGNVVLTGRFAGIAEFLGQFQTGETLLSLTPGGKDMFAVQYSPVGELSFVLQAGGNGAEGKGIYMDDGGSFTVVGDFAGTIRFLDRNNNEQDRLTSQDGNDGFVVRYNRDGQLRFVTPIAGPGSDSAVHVVQKRLDIYVAGSFFNQVTIGATRLTSRGQNDTYVARINSLDGSVQRVTQIGSDNIDFLRGLDGDDEDRSDGNIFVSGTFFGPQLTIGEGSTAIQMDKSDTSSRTAYLTSISVDGGVFIPSFGQIVQGQFNTNRITVDEEGANVHLAGSYESAVTFGSRATGRAIDLPEPTGNEAMAVAHYVPDSGDDGGDDDLNVFYVSSTTGGTVDGINFRDEDVLAFSTQRQAWTLLIDGSDIGLAETDINALHWQPDGSVLLSINRPLPLTTLGEIDDSDILRFIPQTLGADTTGTFEIFLRGADVGLTTNGEDIDAIAIDADGRLVISTLGSARVPSANGELAASDEDLLVRTGDVWELLFDGSDVGLTDRAEDVAAAWVDANSFTLSTLGAFTIGGLSGDADDIFICKPTSTGDDTQVDECAIFFDSSANRLADEVVDAFSIGKAGTEGTEHSDDNNERTIDESLEDDVEEDVGVYLSLIVW